MQDDLTKFVSDPASPPRLVDITEEGKGRGKEHREVGEGDDTVTIEDTSDEEDGRRFRSYSSCGPGLAVLDCPTCPSSMILQLAWRLVSLRREEATQCGTQARRQEIEGHRDNVSRGKLLE
jgi:hypothetical protein